MDGPGHDKECADNDNETYIFAGGMLNPSRTVKGEEVIAAGGRRQERPKGYGSRLSCIGKNITENCVRSWKRRPAAITDSHFTVQLGYGMQLAKMYVSLS